MQAAVLSAANLHLSFGAREILGDVTFTVNAGERVALMGDNGAGKSTLLKCLAAQQVLDGGEVRPLHNARVVLLGQSPSFDDEDATVRDTARTGLQHLLDDKARYDALLLRAGELSHAEQGELSHLQTALEAAGAFDLEHRVDEVLARLNLPRHDQPIRGLSGGERRRLDLARVLLSAPDVLLLDEPTNHLDAGGIRFLVDTLNARPGSLLFVSHDRVFTDAVATRIIELHRGEIFTHPAPTEAYLERRLERQAVEQATLSKKTRMMARELAWLRTGPKARTTKSEARKQRAHALIDEVKDGRQAMKERRLEVQRQKEARLAKTILEFRSVGLSVEGRDLFDGLDLIVVEGERWGIVGENGAGKTTLLRAILGERPVDRGEVKMGPHTKVAVFDQAARSLDDEATLQETLAEGDHVHTTQGRTHVATYLEKWLFDPADRGRKVGTLSGGEKNRLLFAKLLASDANCLLLDEPTNDLDLDTLGVLEEALFERGGVAIIVSHDARFLDRVATGILSFEEGTVRPYQGDYTQWDARKPLAREPGFRDEVAKKAPKQEKQKTKTKRSYKEEREYETIEADVLAAEADVERLTAQLEDPAVMSDGGRLMEITEELNLAQGRVEHLYARWQELEEISS
jgi:ATP-binding cassette subfamily F protein uup